MIKKIGIECQNLEGERFGVGQTLAQLLKSLPENKEVLGKYRFVLYFNQSVPDDQFLNNPIFEKKILRSRFFESVFNIRFNVFYHVLLPLAYHKDKLDGMLFPSYMLPAFFISSPPHLFAYNAFRYFFKKISFDHISLPPIKSRCGGKSITVLTSDAYYESHYGNLPFKYKLAYRIFCWLAAKRSNKILTISNFSRQELARLYKINIDRIAVISWGLNEKMRRLDKTPDNIQKIAAIKARLEIKNDFILSVGQAFPRRKIKESMLAFEILCQTNQGQMQNIQYVVACIDKYNPPIIDELAQEINKRLGRKAIVRTGYLSQDDILHLFNNADVLVYISSQEAMGLPPMEALKCGTVPLVADNELTREMLGENAFFVKDVDSPESIATEMFQALTNSEKRGRILESGQEAMQKFSWKTFGDRLIKLFDETF